MKRKVLGVNFFNKKSELVAKEILGKFLVRKIGRKEIALLINEVEIYDGFKDLASHARHGPEKRGKLMFGRSGVWYVYFTYGMHWMLNVTTRERGYPAAILIRGAGEWNGPAKLTKALSIDKKYNGLKASEENNLWIEDRGIEIRDKDIVKTPRIGINHSGPIWANKKLRFVLKNNKKGAGVNSFEFSHRA